MRSFFLMLILLLGTAQAQILVPNFGDRGNVSEEVVQELMESFRAEIGRQTGLVVSEGSLTTPGIASSLDPELTLYVAELEQIRYALSGEISLIDKPNNKPSYVISILIVDAEESRNSDLISETLDLSLLDETLRRLTSQIVEFISPVTRLEPGSVGLFISSQPGEADVFINSLEVGKTSSLDVLMLTPGLYEIEVRKDGFLPEMRKIELREGETEFVNVSLTAVAGGSIQLTSYPNAQVFVDNEVVGETPLTVQARPGTRLVRLERPGFEAISFDVPVQNYRVTRVSEELKPLFNTVVFWDRELAAQVEIDGRLYLEGFTGNLELGRHSVRVSLNGSQVVFDFELSSQGVYELDVTTQSVIPLKQE